MSGRADYTIRGYPVLISLEGALQREYGIRCAVPECSEERTALGTRDEVWKSLEADGWGETSMGALCPEHIRQLDAWLTDLDREPYAKPSPDILRLVKASPSR